MSFFKRIADSLAGRSEPLNKLKEEAERRRASKSNLGTKNVPIENPIEKTAAKLAARIDSHGPR